MSGLVPMSEKEMNKRAKQKREMLRLQQQALRKAVEKAKKEQDDWVMVERASAIDMIESMKRKKGGKRKTRKHKKKHRRKTKRKRRVKRRRKTRRR